MATPEKTSFQKVEDNIESFMHPKNQLAHTLLFALSATLTIIHSATSSLVDNSVTLTTVRMLKVDDLYDRTKITSKAEILARWKCNATSNVTLDPWGPDSMCRCVRREACSGDACGDDLEKKCYKKVAPAAANVFAGYDVGYLNVIIAFFLIHIAVLINMTIETEQSKVADPLPTSEKQDPVQPIPANHVTPSLPKNDDHPGTYKPPSHGYDPNNPHQAKRFGRSMVPLRHFRTIVGDPEGDTNHDQTPLMDHIPKEQGWRDKLLQKEPLRLILLLALAVTCAVLSVVLQAKKDSMNKNGQSCDVAKSMSNSCMTSNMLASMTFFVSFVDCIAIAAEFYNFFFTKDWHKPTRLFLAGVLEDTNHIIAFMLLAATFTALSGVHDDATLLFDVLVVLFLGFLQSVQHHLMVQREHVIAYCHAMTEKNVDFTDHLGRVIKVEKDVLGYFLNTRLFIFVIMIFSGVVFLQRIEPTNLSNDTSATWHYHMRNVALLVSVLPGVISDLVYEIKHAANMRTQGQHTEYTGPGFWRRGIYLGYMIAFILISWKTYSLDAAGMPPTAA